MRNSSFYMHTWFQLDQTILYIVKFSIIAPMHIRKYTAILLSFQGAVCRLKL